MFKQLYSPAGVWLAWFGVAAGVVSCISLVTRWFDVGLQPIAADLVEFYRQLVKPIYDALRRLRLPFTVTPMMVELATAYAALVGLATRAEFTKPRNSDVHLKAIDYGALAGYEHSERSRRRRRRIAIARSLQRIAGTAALLPVLSLQPIRDFFYMQAWSRSGPLEPPPENEPGSGWYRRWHNQNVLWRKDNIRNVLMFFAFPVAVVLFFALNAYV